MSDQLLERGLPQNLEAEKFVLGAILRDDACYPAVSASTSEADFGLERHRRIFHVMDELFQAGTRIDFMTVFSRLRDRGEVDPDSMSYLTSLDEGLSEIFEVDAYTRIVKEKSVLRRAITECRKLENQCLMHGDSLEVIGQAEAAFRDLTVETQPRGALRTIPEIVERAGNVNKFLKPYNRPCVRFPWNKLNQPLGGMYQNEMIVLAARPGVGKTAFAMQCGEFTARITKKTVAVFNLEMSGEQLLHRMACARAGVDSNRFRQGYLTAEEEKRVFKALTELCDIPLRIDDTPRLTVPALHAALRKLSAREEIGLVIVDYIQLMESAVKASNRAEAVSGISRGLKIATGEFRVPFLVLSQLNRSSVTDNRKPGLADLRESGSIEQDANTVLILHEPEKRPEDPMQPVVTEVLIEKQRNGPVGMRKLHFIPQHVSFVEDESDAD